MQYYPGKRPKESSYTDASGVIRQGEYDAAMRHWQNRSDKFLEHKDNMAKDYQKAQGWLYRLLCNSFTQTNLTKIQIYEPNTFRNSLMKESPALTVEDVKIQFMPYGSLLWNAIKPEYVQSGSSSLIIHMSGWTTLTGVGFQELLKKSNETVAIQKYAQEAEMKWQRCSEFYKKLDPATIASMQVLMGAYAYGSDSLRIGVQEIFKELDNGQNMTVSEVSKKLYTMAQVEEAKDHLQKANGGKKKKSELVLGVNTVQGVETKVCDNPNCGVTFTPSKPWHFSCDKCHNSGFRRKDSLSLTADAQKKHKEKQLQKKKAKLAKKRANKGVEKKGKKGGKAFQASIAAVGSDSDEESEDSDSNEEETSNSSESETEQKKEKKRKRKSKSDSKGAQAVKLSTTAAVQAQVVDILNSMDKKQRKKLLKYYIGSSTVEMSMQSAETFSESDLCFNTLRNQDQAISSLTVEFLENSSENELPELDSSVEEEVEEISVQLEQTPTALLLTEMEQDNLADNLDEMLGNELAIEDMVLGTLNVSRQTQVSGQMGYSLSPQEFANSVEIAAAGMTRPDSRASAQELLIRRGYRVIPVAGAYERSPFNFATAVRIIAAFSAGEEISPASLAHAINAFAAHEKIPKQIILGIPGHFMLADTGATMHLLLCLMLAFNDMEANRPVRGFNGSESICTRVAYLAFSAPVICQGRQMDKSITSGAHDAYITLDITRPIFSIVRAVQQGHAAHFGGDTPGLYLNVLEGNINGQPYIPFVKAENIDGVSGLKYFVPTKPLVKVSDMHFDINMQEDTIGVFAADEQTETNAPVFEETAPENAD